MIVLFVGIGGIVDHYCSNFLFIDYIDPKAINQRTDNTMTKRKRTKVQ
jgi:hypothetical protein